MHFAVLALPTWVFFKVALKSLFVFSFSKIFICCSVTEKARSLRKENVNGQSKCEKCRGMSEREIVCLGEVQTHCQCYKTFGKKSRFPYKLKQQK